MQLHDLTIVGTLGVGGYGRVELVQYKKTKETFALKYLKKIDMVQQQRQEHAYSEKDIMLSCDTDFIARFVRYFRKFLTTVV
jgi:cGMP-dependent protein kinase 1